MMTDHNHLLTVVDYKKETCAFDAKELFQGCKTLMQPLNKYPSQTATGSRKR